MSGTLAAASRCRLLSRLLSSFSGPLLGTEFQLRAVAAAWERTLRSASNRRSRDAGASVGSVLPASGGERETGERRVSLFPWPASREATRGREDCAGSKGLGT